GSALGLSGYLLWGETQAHASNGSETRVLGRALGRELQTQGDISALANKLARDYLRQPLAVELGKRTHRITRAALGVRVDLIAFSELLRAAGDPRSPLRRLHLQQRGDAPLDLPVPARLEGDRAERWLGSLASLHDRAPRPARIDFETSSVIAAVGGQKLDVQATLDALASAIFDGATRIRAPLLAVAPPPSRFAAPAVLDVSRVLGSFESAAADDLPARRQALERAARELDGALIAPGEVFDVRGHLGVLHGGAFQAAGVSLVEGDLVEAAVSQVASTLYAAALFAGLPILEQHPRARPSTDIELGFDASISAAHNLRFENDLEHPLAIAATVQKGRVRVSLRGTASHTREVDVERTIERVSSYAEVTRADPSLASGALVVVQRGRPGLRVQLTRSVRETEDDTSSREQRTSVYAPSPRIVRVGDGKHVGSVVTVLPSKPALGRANEGPSARHAAELVVDEFVGFGMRPGMDLPQESGRRAGRTGVEGWTAQDGP
ncbi:MAG: Vancomycin B-type resistance protein VanW, partial [Myxococcaceae bacterium]|nr:Vancomycin B-type resistance protein VanW [Myxococcaceae bacterium]